MIQQILNHLLVTTKINSRNLSFDIFQYRFKADNKNFNFLVIPIFVLNDFFFSIEQVNVKI